ncbi:hypothetical protein [Verrucosispora sioxanthis]|nr:hypothetical protein [Verrucosispora sioxanthis]
MARAAPIVAPGWPPIVTRATLTVTRATLTVARATLTVARAS